MNGGDVNGNCQARTRSHQSRVRYQAPTKGSTHYPLGEWYSASAVSARTTGWIRPPSTIAFWNVEIAKR